MDTIKTTIMNALKAKIAAGESQASIARAAQLSPGRLSDFVNGKCELQTSTASRLAKVVGVTIAPPPKRRRAAASA